MGSGLSFSSLQIITVSIFRLINRFVFTIFCLRLIYNLFTTIVLLLQSYVFLFFINVITSYRPANGNGGKNRLSGSILQSLFSLLVVYLTLSNLFLVNMEQSYFRFVFSQSMNRFFNFYLHIITSPVCVFVIMIIQKSRFHFKSIECLNVFIKPIENTNDYQIVHYIIRYLLPQQFRTRPISKHHSFIQNKNTCRFIDC